MSDLHERFRSLDAVRVPELWPEVEARATASGPAARLEPRIGRRATSGSTSDRPTSWVSVRWGAALVVVLVLLAALLAALAVGAFNTKPRVLTDLSSQAPDHSAVVPTPGPSAVAVARDSSGPPSRTANPATCGSEPATNPIPSGSGASPIVPSRAAVTTLQVRAAGLPVVATGCTAWVETGNGTGVARLDLFTNKAVAEVAPSTVEPDGQIMAVRSDGPHAWVLGQGTSSAGTTNSVLALIDPTSDTLPAPLVLDIEWIQDVAVADATAWAAADVRVGNNPMPAVFGIDTVTGRIVATIVIPGQWAHLVGQRVFGIGGGAVWIGEAGPQGWNVLRVDLVTHAITDASTVVASALGTGVYDCLLSTSALFCLTNDSRLARVALDASSVLGSVHVPLEASIPSGFATDGDSVWLMPTVQRGKTDWAADHLLQFDGRSGSVMNDIPVRLAQPDGLSAAGGSLSRTSRGRLLRIEPMPVLGG